MKKIVKICLISLVLIATFASVLCGSLLAVSYAKYQKIPLNTESITSPSLFIEVYDSENKPMKEENQFNGDFCKFEDIPQHTKDAFISIEDKDFYKHNGLNKKRIAKAMLNNLKSMRLKEGASTISQQLIKNTHLSNEKTFERKLKEIALTKKLEKSFSKEEILESYLNIIFFGNNCYGIESASRYYFDKEAKDLNLNESCTLAGIIKSPTKYSPILNYENSLKRRNLILSEMEKDGKITIDEKIATQNQPITLSVSPQHANKLNSYSQASIDESAKILGISAKQIAIGGYKIHTYCDENKQNAIKNALSNNKIDGGACAGIVIDAKTHGVTAFSGECNYKILDLKRQPASCLKPLLVYAPALNEDVITPATQILDEPLKIGDYTPANVSKKFKGYVSVTDSVKQSINIPAIKVLSYIGIDTGKQYAEKMGIKFDENDDSYALALGGMTYGTNLKDLTSAYTTFANNGLFANSTFVQYITDKNNKLVYIHKPIENMVFREDSSFLMTSILQETAKSGTARKLSNISNTEVASKTGTVGKKNASGNIDAYNISYTPTEAIGVWYGSISNEPIKIAGGNQPTEIARQYISSQTYEKTTFDVPSSVTEVKIDTIERDENHRLAIASQYAPARYTETCLFSRFNMPSDISQNFIDRPQINAEATVEKNQIVIKLDAQKHLKYTIEKDNIPLQTLTEKQGQTTLRFAFPEQETAIKITATYNNSENGENLASTKIFKLCKTKSESRTQNQKWYI